MIDFGIDENVARKVLETVDAGLVSGVGIAEPGKMCVEAAVCYALGLPHGDDPECVSRALRSLKIRLNDSQWSSDQARGKGMRRLALAQLGSRNALDDKEFTQRVIERVIGKYVAMALRHAARLHKDEKYKAALLEAADRCETEKTRDAAQNARLIAYAATTTATATATATAAATAAAAAAAATTAAAAAAAAVRDAVLAEFAEDVVQILVDMKAPGCQWLYLTEVA